jgi:hypothetical protein
MKSNKNQLLEEKKPPAKVIIKSQGFGKRAKGQYCVHL